jgi:hypothetical protein
MSLCAPTLGSQVKIPRSSGRFNSTTISLGMSEISAVASIDVGRPQRVMPVSIRQAPWPSDRSGTQGHAHGSGGCRWSSSPSAAMVSGGYRRSTAGPQRRACRVVWLQVGCGPLPTPRRSLLPRLPDRCRVLPRKIRVQGERSEFTQAQRAPLTLILARRQNARREEDGPVSFRGPPCAGAALLQ